MVARLILIACLLVPCVGFGQIGIHYNYILGKSDFLDQNGISQDGHQILVEYNFRLKQKRLEFRPGAGYHFTTGGSPANGHFKGLDLDFGVAIYPFDFGGDCNCPTFSKEGKLFKKGLFFEVSPGASLQHFTRTEVEGGGTTLPLEDDQLIWKIGASVGIDIGLSDMITITPMFSLVKYAASDWEGLNAEGTTGRLDDYNFMAPGIRLTYHPDEKRRRRH